MAKDKKQTIIIRKVVKKGGGHHGGSWKVAYADFVTAMMAFFMVMWIMGMDEDVKDAIEGYFTNPIGFQAGHSTGAAVVSTKSAPGALDAGPMKLFARSMERERFEQLGERIMAELEGPDGLGSISAQVEIVITDEGLRIELIEDDDGETFFAFGSAELKPSARHALRIIGSQIAKASSVGVIEGHTDSAPFGSAGYTNWELSADRANAARRAIQAAGVRESDIAEIRGHADRDLRNAEDPLDPENRRISILLPFSTPPANTVEYQPAA